MLVPVVAGCLVFQDSGHGLECILWSPTLKRVKVHANHNITFRFFVECQPTGAYALFHHDINCYINQLVSLFEVLKQMEETIQEAYTSSLYLHEFIERMNEVFYSLVERNNQEDTKLGALLKTKQDIGYSARQLQRLYQKHFGCFISFSL